MKMKGHSTKTLPVVLCGCKTWYCTGQDYEDGCV